jgi:hypothetical protein
MKSKDFIKNRIVLDNLLACTINSQNVNIKYFQMLLLKHLFYNQELNCSQFYVMRMNLCLYNLDLQDFNCSNGVVYHMLYSLQTYLDSNKNLDKESLYVDGRYNSQYEMIIQEILNTGFSLFNDVKKSKHMLVEYLITLFETFFEIYSHT